MYVKSKKKECALNRVNEHCKGIFECPCVFTFHAFYLLRNNNQTYAFPGLKGLKQPSTQMRCCRFGNDTTQDREKLKLYQECEPDKSFFQIELVSELILISF